MILSYLNLFLHNRNAHCMSVSSLFQKFASTFNTHQTDEITCVEASLNVCLLYSEKNAKCIEGKCKSSCRYLQPQTIQNASKYENKISQLFNFLTNLNMICNLVIIISYSFQLHVSVLLWVYIQNNLIWNNSKAIIKRSYSIEYFFT